MTEHDVATVVAAGELPLPVSAGALLRAAREAGGLSIDAVAQQLKLAPRQVRALEEGDYTHLPGRTFVRGFIRNYARLLRLDAEAVLGALPGGAAAPALEAPTLQQTAPTIGELPTTDHAKPGWARWAIPATLVAIVAAAAVYEWLRPAGDARMAGGKEAAVTSDRPARPSTGPDRAGTPLPNPVGGGAADVASAVPSPVPAADPVTAATPMPPTSAPAAGASPAAIPAATSAAPAAQTTPSGTAATAEPALMLTFRDYSWTEVRDRDGRTLLSGMNPGGTTQALSGAPPLEIVIGNAADVRLSYHGQPIDLVPYTRQNVARFTLP